MWTFEKLGNVKWCFTRTAVGCSWSCWSAEWGFLDECCFCLSSFWHWTIATNSVLLIFGKRANMSSWLICTAWDSIFIALEMLDSAHELLRSCCPLLGCCTWAVDRLLPTAWFCTWGVEKLLPTVWCYIWTVEKLGNITWCFTRTAVGCSWSCWSAEWGFLDEYCLCLSSFWHWTIATNSVLLIFGKRANMS